MPAFSLYKVVNVVAYFVPDFADATAVPLLPATTGAAEADDGDDTVLHIAEGGTAALAVLAAGAFVYGWRRRPT